MVEELGTSIVLLWTSPLPSLGLNVFICYKRGMVKVIYKFIFESYAWGKNTKILNGNLGLRLIKFFSEKYFTYLNLIPKKHSLYNRLDLMIEGINIFLKGYAHLVMGLGSNSDHSCKPTKYVG